MKRYIWLLLYFTLIPFLASSQVNKGRVIDYSTLKPIENVAIQVNAKIGFFTDTEGHFSIRETKSNKIAFSCIGYETKILTLDELKANNYVVKLKELENSLEEVVLSNRKLNLEELFVKINQNISTNFKSDLSKQAVFYRSSNTPRFKKVEFELDRSSLLNRKKRKEANKSFQDFSAKMKATTTTIFTDYFTNLYVKTNVSTQKIKNRTLVKIDSIKGIRVNNGAEEMSIEGIQKHWKQLVLQHLNQDKTYKVKTGLFKVDDSLSIKNVNSSLEKNKDSLSIHFSKRGIANTLFKMNFLKSESTFNFLNRKYYKHQLIRISFINEQMTYLVRFSSRKSKAKFKGIMYISADDFGITRVDYGYDDGKKGEHLNLRLLLGVKFSENYFKGTILYKKNAHDVYYPYYAKETTGRYFYINRSFKFIENSRKKNKVKFGLKVEGNFYNKNEIVVVSQKQIDNQTYKDVKELKRVPFISLSDYNASIWSNGKLLLPFNYIEINK